MSSNPSSNFAIAWLYIDGNIIHNGIDGCSYDRQMARLVKLDVGLKYKQLCDIICTKLNIDTSLHGLKIMHRCFNPVTKMFGFAPVLDDDDVELMFELVTSFGLKNCVVELYLERVLVDKSVDVQLGLNSSSEQAGFLFDFDLDVSRDMGKFGENVAFCRDLGERGVVVEDVEGSRDLGLIGENVVVGRDLGEIGENMEVNRDLGVSGENVASGGLNKKMLYMQHVNSQGRRVSRGRKKGGKSGISLSSSLDGSSMFASRKEPVFTMRGDMLHVTDLKKGMVFVSREELADIVFQVHYRNQQEVKVTRADSLNWTVVCKRSASGCMWRLKARKRKHHGLFEIMTISSSHTCVDPTVKQDHANLIVSNNEEVPDAQVDVDHSFQEKVYSVVDAAFKEEMTEV